MMVAIVVQYISQTDSTCQAQNNGINKLDFYKRRAIHMPPAFGARKLFIQKGLFDRKVRQLRRCSKLPLETTTAATSLSYRGNYAWVQKEDPSDQRVGATRCAGLGGGLRPVLVGEDRDRRRTIPPLAGRASQQILRLARTLRARQ